MIDFVPYAHALAALALWSLLMSVLMTLSVSGTARVRAACGLPARDYSDPMYRRSRAFLNSVESAGPIIAATLVAILVGAPAIWVNILASVFLVSRIGMAGVHIFTENQKLRSLFFMIGFLCTLALTIMAIVGAFTL